MKISFGSTFSRIIWLQVAAIAATSVIMPVSVLLLLNRTVTAYQHRLLRQHEQSLLRALSRDHTGLVLRLPDNLRDLYARGSDGFAFAVLDQAGHVRFSSAQDGRALSSTNPMGAQTVWFTNRIRQGPDYQGASFPEQVDGQRVWIQIGQNLEDPDVVIDDIMAHFIPQIAWLTLVILLLLLTADVVIVRRALIPVLRASRMAQDISPSRIDVRLPLQGMPQEIMPLVRAVNQALDRLEQGFRAQRELTADVAHELRTPLAVLRMRTEALEDGAARRALQSDLDLMSRIVSQLLVIAEVETVIVGPDDRADLRAISLDVAEHLAPLALAQDKNIEVCGARSAVWVRGQADFLFQALRNLAENGLAHTRPGTAVTMDVGQDGSVRILDRGPGIAASDRELLFQRFWRSHRKKGGGAGLGLSIVGRIVKAHGGSTSIHARRGGGAIFKIVLVPATGPQGPPLAS
jgi:signal transduction histidine kinase